ncbi:MAG: tRNA pseudouridine(55) synthase TruB [Steroidobacteraceae bacterium]
MDDEANPRPRRFDREVDGILLLDKPTGISSNSALQQARRLFRALKAGHAGSLDPLASGLLPVCFGQATKVCGQLLESGKAYRVVARLGEQTDTADAEGQVIATQPVPPLDRQTVEAAVARFVGDQTQVPPMYSALKHEGKRLYELARQGETVERAARHIHIGGIDVLRVEAPEIELDVACSKGTYIRTLVEDVARALGTLGHVTALRRLKVDAFGNPPMVTFAELEAAAAHGDFAALAAFLLPIDHVFMDLPRVDVDEAGERHLTHGRRTWPAQGSMAPPDGRKARAYGPTGGFIGLVERQPDGALQPNRLFVRAAGLAV